MWHDFRFLLLLDNFQYNFRYLVVIINNFYRSIDKSHNFVQKYICKSRVSSSFITSTLSPFSMSSWEILINSNSLSEWVIKTLNTSMVPKLWLTSLVVVDRRIHYHIEIIKAGFRAKLVNSCVKVTSHNRETNQSETKQLSSHEKSLKIFWAFM